jgi:hypothetical protein
LPAKIQSNLRLAGIEAGCNPLIADSDVFCSDLAGLFGHQFSVNSESVVGECLTSLAGCVGAGRCQSGKNGNKENVNFHSFEKFGLKNRGAGLKFKNYAYSKICLKNYPFLPHSPHTPLLPVRNPPGTVSRCGAFA